MRVQQVSILPREQSAEISTDVLCACFNCGKTAVLPEVTREICDRLSKPNHFYCSFCLRHHLYGRNTRHVLILTFRSVFAWYYHQFYRNKVKKVMWMSQIEDYVSSHAETGLLNPVFRYDPESFLWFVDFERVGQGKRKIPVTTVKKTVLNILATFNLYDTVPTLMMYKFWEKYSEAIDTFYTQRSRPDGKKILCPTFLNCGVADSKEIPFDRMRDFTPQEVVVS